MKFCLLLIFSMTSLTAMAQSPVTNFPKAAIEFLDVELPKMEAAVAAKNRAYFVESNVRVQSFLDASSLKSNAATLEAYPMCADAVTDFQIVGLCRILPAGTICDPTSFVPKFEKNLALAVWWRELVIRSSQLASASKLLPFSVKLEIEKWAEINLS